MKTNFIFKITAISLLISANAYALEITSGKLIDHKERFTGDAKIAMRAKPGNLLTQLAKHFKKFRKQTYHHDFVFLANRLDCLDYVVADADNDVYGFQTMYLKNGTSMPHTYTITSNLCVIKNDSTDSTLDSCLESTNVIYLNPEGTVSGDSFPSLSYHFGTNTEYTAMMTAIITRDDLSTEFATGDVSMVYLGDPV